MFPRPIKEILKFSEWHGLNLTLCEIICFTLHGKNLKIVMKQPWFHQVSGSESFTRWLINPCSTRCDGE